MRRKTETAVPEMVKTAEALADLEKSLKPEVVAEFKKMAELWEADSAAPNPFETQRKEKHIAKVRAELAAEAAARAAAKKEAQGEVRGDMHITELLGMGLQLEEQQRVIAFDMAGTGLHPTDGQRRAILERSSKLRRKIVAWIDLQTKFFPGLQNVRELEDEVGARAAESQQAVPGLGARGCSEGGGDHLRGPIPGVSSAHRARAQGAVQSEKIAALNSHVRRAAAQYRVARRALVTLGRVLKLHESEWTLQDLKGDDIRGLPQSRFGDPERQQGKKGKKKAKVQQPERPISWIWINRGEEGEPGDQAAMDEAVWIEWAKTRARAMRWREEVDLLEEEMRRTQAFHLWRVEWWEQWVGQRGLEEGPQLEGETAYVLRQAVIQRTLEKRCAREWTDLPDLIRRGRAGVIVGGDVESEDKDEDGGVRSDEEGEPIPQLPQREVKTMILFCIFRAHCARRRRPKWKAFDLNKTTLLIIVDDEDSSARERAGSGGAV
ncbi:hypothetical protein DFH07DRAFT_767230 [Mycena maculata]|uniref:Uncharacterized protein n=1 Tax=Mycena maculata TaxID=230809 RepID=A0AAD7NTZ5_9AGAR|nr:hypothetical protein DFH07DRAFT_767230 [Mycena maculata]